MLAHPVRREVRWRSALRRALSVVVRRSMESKIDQRMRIGELVYMKCRLRCFFMRETPPPLRVSHFPAIPLCETPHSNSQRFLRRLVAAGTPTTPTPTGRFPDRLRSILEMGWTILPKILGVDDGSNPVGGRSSREERCCADARYCRGRNWQRRKWIRCS